MVWIACLAAVLFLAAALLLLAQLLFVLNVWQQLRDCGKHPLWFLVEDLSERVAAVVLVASGLVGGYAFAYRAPLPQGAEPDQGFHVVVGCDVEVRREAPTVLEQLKADAACYFVPLLAAVAPECEAVAGDEADRRQQQAERACERQVIQIGLQGLALMLLGFVAGYYQSR